ncbi:MAG: efflux RND transporter periplasmic adaptor subunit [Vicinamibacteraceae bacterium]
MTRTAQFITGSIFVASALALTACGGDASEAAGPKTPTVIEIGRENVVEVKSQEITVGPLVSGELKAEREATVRAEIGGAILQVYPREGESVAAGALLARIEGRPLNDAYASAQSGLRSVEQNAEWAQKEATRIETLVKGGALAERDAEVARNAATQAKAAVDDARSRVASARKSLDDLIVKAPIGGIVSKRHVNAGDVVSPGGELYTIIDPSSMRLEASVPSEQIAAIQVGGAVTFQVRGYPQERFEGRIERISPSADSATRQVPIFVTIPNKQRRLVAGLFAEGRVAQASKTGLIVPQTAVNENSGKPWVLKVQDGKAQRVEVTVGLRDEQTEQLEITGGVAAGDLLLVGAAQGMTPDTPLRVKAQGASSN